MDNLKSILNDLLVIYNLSELSIIFESERKENNSKINEIYKKYKVNNIDELVTLINNYALNVVIPKDKELTSLIVLLILDENKRKILNYNDNSLKEIYKYIIKNNLYDPNWNIGVSSEPLFMLLPNSKDLYSTNLQVFNNKSIDWNILYNESDSFVTYVYKYLNSDSEEEKHYYFEIIKNSIDRIDFNSTQRYKSIQKKVCCEVEPISKQLKGFYDSNLDILIKQKNKLKSKK